MQEINNTEGWKRLCGTCSKRNPPEDQKGWRYCQKYYDKPQFQCLYHSELEFEEVFAALQRRYGPSSGSISVSSGRTEREVSSIPDPQTGMELYIPVGVDWYISASKFDEYPQGDCYKFVAIEGKWIFKGIVDPYSGKGGCCSP